MALDKEFLTGVFEGIEGADDRIEKVLKEYEADTTGLKVNKDNVIKESREYKEKLDKITQERDAEKSTFQKRIDELEKQVKAAGSDETKAFYEAEIKKTQEMYASQLSDTDKRFTELEAEKLQIYAEYVNVLKETEFEKAAEKIGNIDPAKKAILRDVFFARNHFDFTTVEGQKKFIGKDYKSVNDTLQAFIATDEGKTFVLSRDSGGGAPGSTSTKTNIVNPFKKETFNLTDQMILIKENPTLAAQLKSQAGA